MDYGLANQGEWVLACLLFGTLIWNMDWILNGWEYIGVVCLPCCVMMYVSLGVCECALPLLCGV